MKHPPAQILSILLLPMLILLAVVPGFAQTNPLPAAVDIYPLGIDRHTGLPALVADSGLGGSPRLAPQLENSSLPFGVMETIADTELRIEALALLPAGKHYAQLSPDAILDELSALLCSVEKLTGLEYWSASRKKMRLLYETVYKIESETSRKPVDSPTPVHAAALDPGQSLDFLAFQKDTSFGANVFGYTLGRGGDSLLLKSQNLTVMRYLLLPFVSPGNMQSWLWVIPCREGLLLYFMMNIESINFAVERVFESTSNRALALLGWLAKETSTIGLSEKVELPVNMQTVGAGKD